MSSEQVRQYHRQYRIDHADVIKKQKKQYRAIPANKARTKQTCAKSDLKRRQIIKLAVFTHYGLCCSLCNEHRLGALNLDHILGNGSKHRKEINTYNFYSWIYQQYLETDQWPEDYRTLCANCNHLEYLKNRPPLSITKRATNTRAERAKTKLNLMNILGGSFCIECGCDNINVLDVHHPNNDGAEHRRELNVIGGHHFYSVIMRLNDFTSRQLSIMCRSCNSNTAYHRDMV